MKQEVLNIFLNDKSLKELKFPEDWVYDPIMFRWHSENHFLMITPALSFSETGKTFGEPYKQYLYLTDRLLASLT